MYKYKYSTGFLKNLIITARWYGELLSVSGLAKEITHTIRVVSRLYFKIFSSNYLVSLICKSKNPNLSPINMLSPKKVFICLAIFSLHRRDGLEGLSAALGLALGSSELQICLEATGRFINDSISQVFYSIF